jgi:long-subunit acyl-CoA synthetase (AMP-forming)
MEVLGSTAAKHPNRPAMKVKRGGKWETTTWKVYEEHARNVAKGFMGLGLEAGKGVTIIGFNSPEWILADVGAIIAGGVPAGIYTTSSPEQCQYITDHCDAQIVVVENQEQLAKFKAVRDQLPKVKAFLVFCGGDDGDDGDDVYSWESMLEAGKGVSDEDLETRIKAQTSDDVCTLIYTSGTTGPPKAVMITHDNLTWTSAVTAEVTGSIPEDRGISYLPLSHIAEQIVSLHSPMSVGSCTWFAESIEQLGANLTEVHPTIFFAVPRVWEKIQAKIAAKGATNPWLKKKIAAWARKKGLEARYAEQKGQPMPSLYGLADKLVYSKVRASLGLDQARLLLTGAAPISLDTLEFFGSLGLPVLELYGMSECSGPATISVSDSYRYGACGTCIPRTEIKIAEDGEICMKGRHVFKGYLKNPEATAEALDDEGWLHSGDLGALDGDGFLEITGRKKDLIITAGGENIGPQMIEGKLLSIPVIAQAVVVGDRRKYLAALLTLDADQVAAAIAEAGSPAKDVASAAQCEIFQAYIDEKVEVINRTLARVQTIKKTCIIPNEFTIEGGELTPTMKIKRNVVNEKYADQIESLYA